MTTGLVFEARLGPDDAAVDAKELARRVATALPHAVIDWALGDDWVQQGLDRLNQMNAPAFYFDAQRQRFGTVARISLTYDEWPNRTAFTYATAVRRDLGDCLDLKVSGPFEMEFLKRAAQDLAIAIGFNYHLNTEEEWGIEIWATPGARQPLKFVRSRLSAHAYPALSLSELADWKNSIHRAVLSWLSQSTFKGIDRMRSGFASDAELASGVIERLIAIAPVQRAWRIDNAAPFHNGIVLEHAGWMSYTDLGGVPSGIVT
jgi:hypothetical protein